MRRRCKSGSGAREETLNPFQGIYGESYEFYGESYMAGQFLSVEEVAELLNLTNAEVVQLSSGGKIHGYRDGTTWKYKREAIQDYLKKQRQDKKKAEAGDDNFGFDTYGDSDLGLMAESSDVSLERQDDDEMEDALPASDSYLSSEPGDADEGSQLGSSDINLTLDNDDVGLGDSALDLGFGDDADLVLGEDDGVGQGSGLSLGEGSGISLMSANDSGISLEGDDGEVLELGDDDVLAMSSGISGLGLGGDDDFSLTPSDEYMDDDDDSGSQVIVLDNSGIDGPMAEGFDGGGDMFAEELGAPADEMGVLPQQQIVYSDAGLPEKPYTVLNIVGLVFCFLMLTISLMFSVDLVRNMWSWNQPTQLNSAMMDWILSLIGGK